MVQQQEQQQHEREVQETLLALGRDAPPQLSCKALLHDSTVAEADMDSLVLLLKSRHAAVLGLQANGGLGSVVIHLGKKAQSESWVGRRESFSGRCALLGEELGLRV